jgi:hypothetical protein
MPKQKKISVNEEETFSVAASKTKPSLKKTKVVLKSAEELEEEDLDFAKILKDNSEKSSKNSALTSKALKKKGGFGEDEIDDDLDEDDAEDTDDLVDEIVISDDEEFDDEDLGLPPVVAPITSTKSKKIIIPEDDEEEDIPDEILSKDIPVVGLILKAGPEVFEKLLNGKKFLRSNFLSEVNENEERINKKKYSEVRPIEAITRSFRSKERKMDESPEELVSRIARELEEEQFVRENPYASQLCAKCNEVPIHDAFRIDKDFGYCEFCAEVLGLGSTKEAKSFEFGIGRNDVDDDDDAAI